MGRILKSNSKAGASAALKYKVVNVSNYKLKSETIWYELKINKK
jgi:hypothetical protein